VAIITLNANKVCSTILDSEADRTVPRSSHPLFLCTLRNKKNPKTWVRKQKTYRWGNTLLSV